MSSLMTDRRLEKVTLCMRSASRFAFGLGAPWVFTLVAGCNTPAKPTEYKVEQFGAEGAYTHTYEASTAVTCEAARRALLSQGYVITQTKSDLVDGKKSFQPDVDTHLEIEFHVTCAASGKGTTAFVNALQERFAIKKTNSSASVGVGAIGAVSLPFGSSDDSLVKVASETIQGTQLYDRFFAMVGQFIDEGVKPSSDKTATSTGDPAKNDNVLMPDNMIAQPDATKK